MSRKLQIFIKILVGMTFFVPLIVLPSSFIFPFIVPKIITFRILALLMLGGYLILISAYWREFRVRLTPINIGVGLFFLSFSVSTFAGVDWYRSFWDNHERMLGLFTIFHFVVYFYIVTSVIKEWRDWKWLLRLFLFTGAIVMIIGLMQKDNPQLLLNQGSPRVSATLGNSIYFSGFGLFLFFMGLLLFLKEKISPFWKYYAGAVALLGLWGIFGGGTRGTLLGLMVGLFVLLVCYLFTLKEYKKIRIFIACLLGTLIIVVGLLFVFRKTDFVRSIPAVGRLAETTMDPKTPRLMAWGIGMQAFEDKPVFGWGPNNYYFAFNKYYRPEFLESGWGETWFDNAHNILVNTLAVQGVFGLLTYFGLFGTAFFMIWKAYKRQQIDLHLMGVSTAFLAAHFVHNFVVFENPTSYIYFFFFLGLINSETLLKEEIVVKDKKIQAGSVSIGLLLAVALITLVLIYSTNVNPAKANNATLESIRSLYSDVDQGMDSFEQALAIPSPHIDDIRNDFSRTAAQIIPSLLQEKNSQTEKAVELFDLVYVELRKNRELHPLDIRVNLQLAELARLGAQLKKDINLLQQAEIDYKEALAESPKRQQIMFMFSALELGLGKGQEAVELVQQVIKDDPLISEGWWRLAVVYSELGKNKEARETIMEAKRRGLVFEGSGKDVEAMIMGTTTAIK